MLNRFDECDDVDVKKIRYFLKEEEIAFQLTLTLADEPSFIEYFFQDVLNHTI